MRFHVLTLFPDMIENSMNTSITGRALEKGNISLNAVNIRDFTKEKHGHVDDYPYGGGAGMVMQAEPIYLAYKSIEEDIIKNTGKKPRVIYTTPTGKVFNQKMAKEFAMEEDLVFLCGVDNVLHNSESAKDESFSNNMLEYPQYTRPYEFMGKTVPDVLLSGDHKKVDEWRYEQSLKRTRERRPDLLE